MMNRYTTLRQLGDGTYGSVLLGKSNETGELVAIKRMKKKFYSWDECLNLREVKSLKKLNHANVVKLKEVIRENDYLYFVFEYMKENLYQLMKERNKLLPESVIRNMTFQILQGLSFIHKHGYFHRDLKPENLLCMGPELVKIADFGLAREIRSQPPYTDYVSTRWYRAPEVLLKSSSYSSPIDIWAVGCIMAELYTLRPLFPGNSEVDEIFKICQVLGTLNKSDWPEGYNLAASMNFRFPKCVPTSLRSLIPNASDEAITLMKDMLQWDPEKRPSAAQALRYPYFHVGQALDAPLNYSEQHKAQAKMSEAATEPKSLSLYKTDQESIKPSSTQEELQTCSQSLHQPLQQISLPQENMEPSTNQAVGPSTLTEGQQEPLSLVKNRQPMGWHTRGTASGAENSLPAVRTGRRRWGQTFIKLVDSWDDSDDADSGVSISKKPTISSLKDRTLNGSGCRFPESRNKTLARLLSNTRPNNPDSTTLSAKQHYLLQSRYLPGINPKSNSSVSSQVTGRNLWASSHLTQGQGLQFADSNNPAKTYMSPFQKRTGAARQRSTLAPIGSISAIDLSSAADLRINSKIKPTKTKTTLSRLTPPNEEYEGWRSRSVIPQIPGSSTTSTGQSTFSRSTSTQPVHGRVDWTAKYGGHR
ncbi:serine/threonine-protein kinase MAK-like [Mastacembelus armatus]|uniref:non-specific serine/threonine protein kinase n=1 Tax=Mastacembelus armatus TaxID=205130 RepID=A0A3Q3LBN7_9TELE|nr:serine/threonine-protein kinase MAK-like [Mastacembelus armatus]XP_026169991.1 serine/threonine-protein kinase MAK-like [Mastacembelus armatus]XP_026169992.1 serine/threonine-protein kinase MAK-like [Mastacembelus armatus]XP_026169993.1 serine/threonine-protein kinase MAK-like [Mastacembelus armatus]